MSLSCENFHCEQFIENECAASAMLRNQAYTVGSSEYQTEHLTKTDLGTAINAYIKLSEQFCRENDRALRSAISYAKSVHEIMPDSTG